MAPPSEISDTLLLVKFEKSDLNILKLNVQMAPPKCAELLSKTLCSMTILLGIADNKTPPNYDAEFLQIFE